VDEAILFAKKFVEDLLSFYGLNTDVKATHEEDVIELSVPSTYLNAFLIGQNGETLRALQYMVSTALKNQGFGYSRINLDVADYKRHRYDRISRRVEGLIIDIRGSGKPFSLDPMNPAERRIVHRTVGESRGVASHSEGIGRQRHVVITPETATDEEEPAEPKEKPAVAAADVEEPPAAPVKAKAKTANPKLKTKKTAPKTTKKSTKAKKALKG